MPTMTRIAPEFPVSNLQAALDHYQQKLGFRIAMQMPGGDYSIVERDDIAIHLFQAHSGNHSPVGIHIFTTDLDALHEELQVRGAFVSQKIERKPWGNRDFRLHDEFGNELKFTEPLSGDG